MHFSEVRSDWYANGELVSRLLARSARGELVRLTGFPLQWMPLFELAGVSADSYCKPDEFLPVVSSISEIEFRKICKDASDNGVLRNLVEIIAASDPVIADTLFQFDSRADWEAPSHFESRIPITNWQSYGRRELSELRERIDKWSSLSEASILVALPCSKKRPYNGSRTHRKILTILSTDGLDVESLDYCVVTSIGLVPEHFWVDPVVQAYDSGVPDIYRVLNQVRRFLKNNKYRAVLDCLDFRPYSDILNIAKLERLIEDVIVGPKARRSRNIAL